MPIGWLILITGVLAGCFPPGWNYVKDALRREEVAWVDNKKKKKAEIIFKGAIVRGDTSKRQLALVFTGDEFADGGEAIRQVLKKHRVKASFFLTGRFYRNPAFEKLIRNLKREGHYLGAHSDKHLLYCDWVKRDSLLVSKTQFEMDLAANYAEMRRFGVSKKAAPYFLPPFEWYNEAIADWTRASGLRLVNYTSGTLSHADYTTPDVRNYRSSQAILQSIYTYEARQQNGLNGFLLLIHIGTDPKRTDKLYDSLDKLLTYLETRNYAVIRIDKLLE